jgi:hypothetical protein
MAGRIHPNTNLAAATPQPLTRPPTLRLLTLHHLSAARHTPPHSSRLRPNASHYAQPRHAARRLTLRSATPRRPTPRRPRPSPSSPPRPAPRSSQRPPRRAVTPQPPPPHQPRHRRPPRRPASRRRAPATPRTSAALRSLPLLDLLHRSFPLSTCRLCRSWLGTCCHRPNPHPSNRTTARRRSWNGHPTVLRERSESGHEERRRVECLKRAEASGLQKS